MDWLTDWLIDWSTDWLINFELVRSRVAVSLQRQWKKVKQKTKEMLLSADYSNRYGYVYDRLLDDLWYGVYIFFFFPSLVDAFVCWWCRTHLHFYYFLHFIRSDENTNPTNKPTKLPPRGNQTHTHTHTHTHTQKRWDKGYRNLPSTTISESVDFANAHSWRKDGKTSHILSNVYIIFLHLICVYQIR